MEILVAKSGGFCRGVKRAVDTAFSVPTENTYILGELIHNQDVVDRISQRGIKTVESVEEVPIGGTVLIRAHGVGKSVYRACEQRKLNVIDCTCTFVRNVQKIVEEKSAEGKTILITGHFEHPEVKGLVGWCSSESYVISSVDDDLSAFQDIDVVLVSQTTFSHERFSKIAENLKKVCRKTVEIFQTICYTTVRRQNEAAEIAAKCDAVLVVGGLNSSNTNKLYEISTAHCKQVFRLKNADDFEYEKIFNFKRVGVIVGASTPEWQTQEVLFKMAENGAKDQGMMAQVMADMGNEERYKKGQIITAKIVQATNEGLYLSGSGKKDMKLAAEEIDCEVYNKDEYAAKAEANEEIEVMVVEVKPELKLSQKMVKKVKEEEAMLADIEAGAEFSVVCTGFNKGGLTAELGTYPVFVPAKEIRSGYVKDLEKYTGKKLRLKVLEIRKERRKEIIASQRVILEAEKAAREAAKAEKEAEFFGNIQVGDIVEGKVERVTSFGAFVSVGGFDCLAHISDLSWTGVKAVTDVLEIGKHYEFKVLKVDQEGKKVSIGYKQLQPQPWDLAAEKYAQGDIVHGKVVRIVPFGAFVELEKGIDGLVHVSQISHEWLENPTSVLTIGQEIDAKILAFNADERKITLSIKAIEPKPETVEVKTDSEKPVRAKKARKSNASNNAEEDDYREWNEGGFGGASIAEMLHLNDEEN